MLNNFDDYANAICKKGENTQEAILLKYLRNYMINLQFLDEGRVGSKSELLSNYEILKALLHKPENGVFKDELSMIAELSYESCRYIAEHLRTRIMRENVMMPGYEAKELGQAGIQWLARRPGRNLREKLSYTQNKLLAIRRRQSLDTGENRLFLAFVRLLNNRITQKKVELSNAEICFQEWAQRFLRSEEAVIIGRWQNDTPNNTLLSDRNYRIIWNQWQLLGGLDDRIHEDSLLIGLHSSIVFFWRMMQELSKYVSFPVEPVRYDYDNFTITAVHSKNNCVGLVHCVPDDEIQINLSENSVVIYRIAKECSCSIIFDNQNFSITQNDKIIGEGEITLNNLISAFETVLGFVIEEKERSTFRTSAQEEFDWQSIGLDIFGLHPRILTIDGKYRECAVRILIQKFPEENLLLPVGTADAIYMNVKSFAISDALHSKKAFSLIPELIESLRRYVKAEKVCMPLPDVYNTFQIAPLRQSIRHFYDDAYFAPESVAAVYQFFKADKSVSAGDFVIVASMPEFKKVTLTMLQARYSKDIDDYIENSKGITWDRHPSLTFAIANKKQNSGIKDKFCFACLEEHLAPFAGYNEQSHKWNVISKNSAKSQYSKKFNISNILYRYKSDHSKIIGEHPVYILLLSDLLQVDDGGAAYLEECDILNGIIQLQKVEWKIGQVAEQLKSNLPPIWTEHLPKLSIKRIFGEFPLIDKDTRIEPIAGIRQNIPIDSNFTLPISGEKDYHFYLMMEGGQNVNEEIPYEARLTSHAFPLKQNVECRLELTYTYGNDNPYDLSFIPVTEEGKHFFSEVHAKWERVLEYPHQNLPWPKFPKDSKTWEDLRHVKYTSKKTGEIKEADYLDQVQRWNQQAFKKCKVVYPENVTGLKSIKNHVFLRVIDNFGKSSILHFFLLQPKELENLKNTVNSGRAISCIVNNDRNTRYETGISNGDWFSNKKGQRMAILDNVDFEGVPSSIAIYPNRYLFSDDIQSDNELINFAIHENKGGRLEAQNIISGSMHDINFYYVVDWVAGEHQYLLNTKIFLPLHQIYNNGRSILATECPENFRLVINETQQKIVQAFNDADDSGDQGVMRAFFRVICLLASDMDSDVYELILYVMMNHAEIITRDLGCALGDLSKPKEEMLLQAIISLGKEKHNNVTVIRLLGKAAWKNEQFLYNLPENIVLDFYGKAIQAAEAAMHRLKESNTHKDASAKIIKRTLTDLKYCFEYILAAFRLREWGSEATKWKLSLNDEETTRISSIIQDFVNMGLSMPHSWVKFSIHKTEEYKKIPDMLYAILYYLQGGPDEIEITSISDEDEE